MTDIITDGMIEAAARAMQLDDLGGDTEQADAIWNDELWPDAYKDAYRRQARVGLEAASLAAGENDTSDDTVHALEMCLAMARHQCAEWKARAESAEAEVKQLEADLRSMDASYRDFGC